VLSLIAAYSGGKTLKFLNAPLARTLLLAGGLVLPVCARAQTDSTFNPAPSDSIASYIPHSAPIEPHAIRWYEPLAVVGGIGLLSALDQPVADHFRIHRSTSGQNIADTWARVGTPIFYAPVTLGVITGGLISRNREVTQTGMRLAFSLLLAGVADQGLKMVFGRERPDGNFSAFDFDPIHPDAAFPSGHTAMAFAMATSLADDIHPTWAKVGLYGLATGVAVSRVYQQRHWMSDVLGGAVVGVASAKFVSGHWTIFGLRAPSFLIKNGAPALGWQFSFHE
jgi:membrane-associated phospholipid phosphatase